MSGAVKKTILVLANSIKKYPSRCVAGIEIIREGEGYKFGKWIRPIDPSQPEGAIPYSRTLIEGSPVVPLQCIEMSFDGWDENPEHPEDWRLTANTEWKLEGIYDHGIFQWLADETGDLWGRNSAGSRRIPAGTAKDTLRLVKPVAPIEVEVFHEYNSLEDKNQFKKFISIPCQGVIHQFSITDPLFEARYNISPGNINKGEPLKFTLNPDGLVIVASLTPPYKGFHYKVAAAIIEP